MLIYIKVYIERMALEHHRHKMRSKCPGLSETKFINLYKYIYSL